MARALGVPVLAPSSVADIIPLGLHAVALSRYAGVWGALKIVADMADASATVTIPALGALGIPPPDQSRIWHPRALVGPGALEAEEDFVNVRIPRVHEYTEVAGLNRITSEPVRPRLAILASGMSYSATQRALSDLGLGAHEQDDLGLRLVKIDLPWPLSPFALRAMVHRAHEVLVIEDKAPVVEEQLKAALYRQPSQPRIYGKEDSEGRSLIPAARRGDERHCGEGAGPPVARRGAPAPRPRRARPPHHRQRAPHQPGGGRPGSAHPVLLFRLPPQHFDARRRRPAGRPRNRVPHHGGPR